MLPGKKCLPSWWNSRNALATVEFRSLGLGTQDLQFGSHGKGAREDGTISAGSAYNASANLVFRGRPEVPDRAWTIPLLQQRPHEGDTQNKRISALSNKI